jgi:GT2 family glycosyltransferase
MNIAIITVNFHSDQDTIELLQGISRQDISDKHNLTTYVVDNSRSASLAKKISRMPRVTYIESPGNIGFATGNNLGLRQAVADGAQILILLNNDTLIRPDFISQVMKSRITKSDVGMVGGLIYFAPGFEYKDTYSKKDLGRVIWYAGGEFDAANVYGSHRGVDEVDIGQYSSTNKTGFVTGCLMVLKADVLAKAGYFDDRFFLYLEDLDLCHRVAKAGYKVIYDPSIQIHHKVAQSSGIGSPLNDYFITRNRLLFGFKHSPLRTKLALFREALRKLFVGTEAQKVAIKDFFMLNFYKGSFIQ